MDKPLLALAILALTLCLLPAAQAELGTPAVFWYSDPVQPGEIALLQGDQFADQPEVELLRLSDGAPGDPQAPPASPPGKAERLTPVSASINSVKVEVPPALALGVYACRVSGPNGATGWVYLNAPQPWWQQGDFGAEASPGGWLRICGRCLSFADKATVVLKGPGKSVTVKPAWQDRWAIHLELPANLATAEYEVWVHNGFGGRAGWRSVGTVRIAPHEPFWKSERFAVGDYGATPDDNRDDTYAFRKALAAVEANGGGILELDRGRYDLQGALVLPEHSLLQGAGQAKTLLEWQDMQVPPESLITGSGFFAVQDLGVNAINHRTLLSVAEAGEGGHGNVWVRRVGLHADRTLATWNRNLAEARRASPAGETVNLHGDNCQFVDCNVYSDGEGCRFNDCTNSVFARNTIYTPLAGWSYPRGRNILFEDNRFLGETTGTHGENIYYARNRVQYQYTGFRELMTTDTGGGSYIGKVTAVEGAQVTLADPYRPVGGRTAFAVMSGKGLGQYREIVKTEGQVLTLDRPLDVPPDAESIVTVFVKMHHLLWVDNEMADGSVAVSMYGATCDVVMAGNTAARTTGYGVLGFNYGGPAPAFYVQVLENRITEGYGMKGPGAGDGWSAISLNSHDAARVGNQGYQYRGPMVRGVVVRNNVLEANSTISTSGTVADTVIDHNQVREATVGINLTRSPNALPSMVLWRNEMDRVQQPMLPAANPAAMHPADAALNGLASAAFLLGKPAPAAWKQVREKLLALQQQPLAAVDTRLGVEACLNQAAQALAAQPDPVSAGAVRALLGLSLEYNQWDSTDLSAHLPAWAPPLTVAAALQVPQGWEAQNPPAQKVVPGGPRVGLRLRYTPPAGTWGVFRLPVNYRVEAADWTLQATEKQSIGSGAINQCAVIGPFPNQSKAIPDRAIHGPERRLDLAGEYDTPKGPLKWQFLTPKDGALDLQKLLGDGKLGVAYVVAVVRARRELPVQFNLRNNADYASLFVNKQEVVINPRKWWDKQASTVLQPGDNVILMAVYSTTADWSLSSSLTPLEEVAPGDLVLVPAEELPAVQALRPTTAPAPQGTTLPFAQGQNWRLVYENSFTWPRLGTDLEILEGGWAVMDGFLQAKSDWATIAYREKVVPPVRVEYDLRPMQNNYRRVMAVGYTPTGEATGRRLWGALAGSGYFLAFGWHDSKTNQLWRQDKPVVVSDKPPYPETGRWQHVIVQFIPPKAEMYVDGVLTLEYTDPEWLPNLDTLSFFDWPPPADITNLRIYTAAQP